MIWNAKVQYCLVGIQYLMANAYAFQIFMANNFVSHFQLIMIQLILLEWKNFINRILVNALNLILAFGKGVRLFRKLIMIIGKKLLEILEYLNVEEIFYMMRIFIYLIKLRICIINGRKLVILRFMLLFKLLY